MTWYALAGILADYPRAARVHLVTEHMSPAGIDASHAAVIEFEVAVVTCKLFGAFGIAVRVDPKISGAVTISL